MHYKHQILTIAFMRVLPGVAGLPGTWTHVLTAGLGSQAAGLPGCRVLPDAAGYCRVAGSLPGHCRVVAGLGCRVAGARAQLHGRQHRSKVLRQPCGTYVGLAEKERSCRPARVSGGPVQGTLTLLAHGMQRDGERAGLESAIPLWRTERTYVIAAPSSGRRSNDFQAKQRLFSA